jgi:hypothetical protein
MSKKVEGFLADAERQSKPTSKPLPVTSQKAVSRATSAPQAPRQNLPKPKLFDSLTARN